MECRRSRYGLSAAVSEAHQGFCFRSRRNQSPRPSCCARCTIPPSFQTDPVSARCSHTKHENRNNRPDNNHHHHRRRRHHHHHHHHFRHHRHYRHHHC